MAKILVYNNTLNRMETYYRNLNESMPYNVNRTLTVDEFRGSSESNILWTDRRTMQSWNNFRKLYGRGIFVGFAFKRPWEGGHSNQSQHYAGVAFDVGQNLSEARRNTLRRLAISSGYWRYVEPAVDTPRWVHFDDRFGVPACLSGGYPLVRRGAKGNYVCIAQDGLNVLGYDTGGLDGVFGNKTDNAVRNYQRSIGLVVDGIIGCNTWRMLQEDVVGKGRTNTTIE